MGFTFSKIEYIYKRDARTKEEEVHNLSQRVLEQFQYKNAVTLEKERCQAEKSAKEMELKAKRSLKIGYKRLTKSCGEASWVHCLPSFFNTNTFLLVKCVWVLITACSWTYWAYQTYGMYSSFISYNVISSYTIGYDTNLDFPGILLLLLLLLLRLCNYILNLIVFLVLKLSQFAI